MERKYGARNGAGLYETFAPHLSIRHEQGSLTGFPSGRRRGGRPFQGASIIRTAKPAQRDGRRSAEPWSALPDDLSSSTDATSAAIVNASAEFDMFIIVLERDATSTKSCRPTAVRPQFARKPIRPTRRRRFPRVVKLR